jgi:hypothetical protein
MRMVSVNAIFSRCGRLLSRFHFWVPAVVVYSRVRPLTLWRDDSKGRFAYACMMARRSTSVWRVFSRLLRCETDRSVENNLWLAKISWSLGRLKLASLIYKRTNKLECTATQRDVTASLHQFAESIIRRDIYGRISALIDQLSLPAPRMSLIITAVSSRYFDLFELWTQQVNRHARGHRVILALDHDSNTRLKNEFDCSVIDLSHFFVFNDGGIIDRYCKSNLWILRVMILRELVARGYTVMSLDLDALLVGDLSACLNSLPDSDVVAQIEDYSIPTDVARKLGFIICCGFMVVKSNPATIEFLERYNRQTLQELDDQLALNHLLAESAITNFVRKDFYTSFSSGGVSWVCPDKSSVSRDLYSGTVIRHTLQWEQPIDQLKSALGLA